MILQLPDHEFTSVRWLQAKREHERVRGWLRPLQEDLQWWLLQAGQDFKDACQVDRNWKFGWSCVHHQKWRGELLVCMCHLTYSMEKIVVIEMIYFTVFGVFIWQKRVTFHTCSILSVQNIKGIQQWATHSAEQLIWSLLVYIKRALLM